MAMKGSQNMMPGRTTILRGIPDERMKLDGDVPERITAHPSVVAQHRSRCGRPRTWQRSGWPRIGGISTSPKNINSCQG